MQKSVQVGRLPEVAADAEWADPRPVLGRVGRTHHNHGRVGALRMPPKLAQDLGAVCLGQIQIQQEEIGTRRAVGLSHALYEVNGLFSILNHMEPMGDMMFL